MLLSVSSVWLLVVSLLCWLVISTWSPPKSLAWQKGFRLGSGLTLRKLGLLLLGCSLLLLVSVVGLRLVVIVGTLLLVVLLLLLLFFLAMFSLTGGLLSILRYGLFLTLADGSLGLRSLFSVLPFGLLLGCLLLIRVVVPSLLRFREFGRYMMSGFNLCLVVMPLCLMSPLVEMMFLLLGLSGRGLLRLLLLMRLGSVVVLFLLGVWFLADVVLCFALFNLVVIGFARLVLMLLMLLMLMFSCIATPLLLLCLT